MVNAHCYATTLPSLYISALRLLSSNPHQSQPPPPQPPQPPPTPTSANIPTPVTAKYQTQTPYKSPPLTMETPGPRPSSLRRIKSRLGSSFSSSKKSSVYSTPLPGIETPEHGTYLHPKSAGSTSSLQISKHRSSLAPKALLRTWSLNSKMEVPKVATGMTPDVWEMEGNASEGGSRRQSLMSSSMSVDRRDTTSISSRRSFMDRLRRKPKEDKPLTPSLNHPRVSLDPTRRISSASAYQTPPSQPRSSIDNTAKWNAYWEKYGTPRESIASPIGSDNGTDFEFIEPHINLKESPKDILARARARISLESPSTPTKDLSHVAVADRQTPPILATPKEVPVQAASPVDHNLSIMPPKEVFSQAPKPVDHSLSLMEPREVFSQAPMPVNHNLSFMPPQEVFSQAPIPPTADFSLIRRGTSSVNDNNASPLHTTTAVGNWNRGNTTDEGEGLFFIAVIISVLILALVNIGEDGYSVPAFAFAIGLFFSAVLGVYNGGLLGLLEDIGFAAGAVLGCIVRAARDGYCTGYEE